jgi:2-haloalkanoic acid dehalogenase type II
VAHRWAEAFVRRRGAIRDQTAPWRAGVDVRREALDEVLVAPISPEQRRWLEGAGRRLRPWPDSPAALRALGERFKLVALSNASLAELAEISARGGLAWHAVLSGALVHAYKPSPAVYELALSSLGLQPSRTLMVAAHAWDLRAAATDPELGGAAVGIGFAISSNTVQSIAKQLIADGRVLHSGRAWLGVDLRTIANLGVVVAAAIPSGPAARAGVQPGDVIARVAGQPVTSVDDIAEALALKQPGQKIDIEVRGPGGPQRTDVTLGELPAS